MCLRCGLMKKLLYYIENVKANKKGRQRVARTANDFCPDLTWLVIKLNELKTCTKFELS